MFAGLDQVNWAALNHAYGPATDIPDLVRDLTSTDDTMVDKAIYTLFGNIWHQGTVYPASAPAIPFLAEALAHLASRHQVTLLGLFAELARGHGYYDVHRHLPAIKAAMEDSRVTDPDKTLRRERAIVRQTTLAVFAQWSNFARLAVSETPAVRIAALHVLSILGRNDCCRPTHPDAPEAYLDVRPEDTARGQWAARVRTLVDERRGAAVEPIERAACLRVLIEMEDFDHPALQLARFGEGSVLESFVILLANAIPALQAGRDLTLAHAEALARLAAEIAILEEAVHDGLWPWGDTPEVQLIDLYAQLPVALLDQVAESCARLIRSTEALLQCPETVLRIILGSTRPDIPDDPCLLSPGQRRIALAVLSDAGKNERFWFWTPTNGNASLACREASVPHDRELWLQWLGQNEPSARRAFVSRLWHRR